MSSPRDKHPGQRDLGRRRALLLGDSLDLGDELEVLRRSSPAGTAGIERRRSSSARSSSDVNAPVRKPRPSGLYATKPMPSSRTVGRISASGSRVQSEYSVWSAVIGWTASARRIVSGAGLGEPEVAHLPGSDELGHRADGLLDRRVRVDAVLVVEVDRLDAEPRERGVARRVDVLGTAVDPDPAAVGVALVAELRREHHLVAPAGDRLARRASRSSPTPYMSAVSRNVTPRSSARWIVAIDSSSSISRVELGHPHAAEADRADLEVA